MDPVHFVCGCQEKFTFEHNFLWTCRDNTLLERKIIHVGSTIYIYMLYKSANQSNICTFDW